MSEHPPDKAARPPAGAGPAETACSGCGYSLAGIAAPGRCPECGRAFTGAPTLPRARGSGRTLPDPAWTGYSGVCIGCSYSLEGHQAPGVCPECGLPFDNEQVVLHGVAQRVKTHPLRRAAWIGFLIVAVPFYWFGWMPIIMRYGFLTAAAIAIIISGIFVVLLILSPHERSGRSRFMISRSGLAVVHEAKKGTLADQPGADVLKRASVIPWSEVARFEFKRISPVWRRLKLRSHSGARLFDAGIRCDDASQERLTAMMTGFLSDARSHC